MFGHGAHDDNNGDGGTPDYGALRLPGGVDQLFVWTADVATVAYNDVDGRVCGKYRGWARRVL